CLPTSLEAGCHHHQCLDVLPETLLHGGLDRGDRHRNDREFWSCWQLQHGVRDPLSEDLLVTPVDQVNAAVGMAAEDCRGYVMSAFAGISGGPQDGYRPWRKETVGVSHGSP